jgi:hypothetical protein
MTNAASPTEGRSVTADGFYDGVAARQLDIFGGEIGITIPLN